MLRIPNTPANSRYILRPFMTLLRTPVDKRSEKTKQKNKHLSAINDLRQNTIWRISKWRELKTQGDPLIPDSESCSFFVWPLQCFELEISKFFINALMSSPPHFCFNKNLYVCGRGLILHLHILPYPWHLIRMPNQMPKPPQLSSPGCLSSSPHLPCGAQPPCREN